MKDEAKARRMRAIAHAIERMVEDKDFSHIVEMGLRDIAARFRFNALIAEGVSEAEFMKAGYEAMHVVGKLVSVEEMMGIMERRFCMRCLGVEFFGIKMDG